MHGALPFVEAPSLNLGVPIHAFGLIVATGVLVGAELLRRHGVRNGLREENLRSMTAWVLVGGFVGAHVFDVLMYEEDRLAREGPLIFLFLWDGISSFGGFLGGALGWALYIWRAKLRPAAAADTVVVGLLPAFTIGRLACTLVHDHIGRETTSSLGVDYPRAALAARGLLEELHGDASVIRAHNLGMYELAYLLPINAVILWMAFRRRPPAGLIAAVTGLGYAPVRFVLERWRLDTSDPRHLGFTFAQWGSIVAVGISLVATILVATRGSERT